MIVRSSFTPPSGMVIVVLFTLSKYKPSVSDLLDHQIISAVCAIITKEKFCAETCLLSGFWFGSGFLFPFDAAYDITGCSYYLGKKVANSFCFLILSFRRSMNPAGSVTRTVEPNESMRIKISVSSSLS